MQNSDGYTNSVIGRGQEVFSPNSPSAPESRKFELISAEPLPAIRFAFRLTIAALGLASAWFGRFVMNPDGISYLDVGRAFWHGNWHAAVNSHWSPLYALLTGAVIRLIHPSILWEFPLVHLVNFAILMATLFCFEFCWRELLRFAVRDGDCKAGQSYLWAGGYLLFIYIHLDQHGIYRDVVLVTPDLLVAAFTYLAGGLTLRICRGDREVGSAALLGAALGIGYLAKAPMFPFGIAVLLALLFAIRNRKRAVATVAITSLVFIGIAAPLVVELSIGSKHLTFGGPSRAAQAWYVNGVRPRLHWQGTPSRPAHHPICKISDWPEAYEFPGPVLGTYPVGFEPTYWLAGIDASFHARLQLAAVHMNLREYLTFVLHDAGFLTAILLVLVLSEESISGCLRRIGAFWPILLPCAFMFLMYALVHWEPRFTTAFAAIVVATALAATRLGDDVRSVKFLRAAVLALGIIVPSDTTLAIWDGRVENWNASRQVEAAEELGKMGIRPGESVAVIGDGIVAYWAHPAGLHIVAEVPGFRQWLGLRDSATAFWSSPPAIQAKLLTILEHTGARAVVGAAPDRSAPPDWSPIGKTGLVLHVFP